jgi:hypothetical protein
MWAPSDCSLLPTTRGSYPGRNVNIESIDSLLGFHSNDSVLLMALGQMSFTGLEVAQVTQTFTRKGMMSESAEISGKMGCISQDILRLR